MEICGLYHMSIVGQEEALLIVVTQGTKQWGTHNTVSEATESSREFCLSVSGSSTEVKHITVHWPVLVTWLHPTRKAWQLQYYHVLGRRVISVNICWIVLIVTHHGSEFFKTSY